MPSLQNIKPQSAAGAAPGGAQDPRSAAAAVQEIFSAIAPRYDLLNHVLSCSTDRLWWARAARAFEAILQHPDVRILDLCCGTCDMTLALSRRAPNLRFPILGADFTHPMLRRGMLKITGKKICLIEADALQLPFTDEQFDLIVSAFGFRNLVNYEDGLREILRLLRPRGEVGILDFSEPRGLFGKAYKIYFHRVLPRIGRMISGVKGAYAYLPVSVERFPGPQEMLARMRTIGFREVSWQPYSFGIAGLFRGKK